VIDKAARVQKLDPLTGKYLGGWRMPEWILGKPTGVTVAPGDGGEKLIYVADTHYHHILIYRPGDSFEGVKEPKVVGQFGEFGEGPGQFVYPTDVAVLMEPDGKRARRIYVSEYGGNDRISVFEHDSAPNSYRFAFAIGAFGSSASAERVEFSRPQSLAIDTAHNELIVTDACNHRLGRLTLEGKLIAWYGSPDGADELPGHFKYPYGLCLLGDGSAMVAEFGNNRVQRIELSTGRSLGCFGTPGRQAGELAIPWGVTVLGDRVYVLDSGNNRVLAFARPLALQPGGG
jgi:DNA-binding beta-propeller fold protein YncE